MQRILPNLQTATILPPSLAPPLKEGESSETEADDSEGRLPLLFSERRRLQSERSGPPVGAQASSPAHEREARTPLRVNRSLNRLRLVVRAARSCAGRGRPRSD